MENPVPDLSLPGEWATLLADETALPYFTDLRNRLAEEYARGPVYPAPHNIFRALRETSPGDTRAVILGQDPYHDPGQANGLAFSVDEGVTPPPSLRNILREVSAETGAPAQAPTDLGRWARQGVLLLNSALTVAGGAPGSHAAMGWERFTDALIRRLSESGSGIAFMLWGAWAQRKEGLIAPGRGHLVLKSAHPSPLSARKGFFGNGHFAAVNAHLTARGDTPVEW